MAFCSKCGAQVAGGATWAFPCARVARGLCVSSAQIGTAAHSWLPAPPRHTTVQGRILGHARHRKATPRHQHPLGGLVPVARPRPVAAMAPGQSEPRRTGQPPSCFRSSTATATSTRRRRGRCRWCSGDMTIAGPATSSNSRFSGTSPTIARAGRPRSHRSAITTRRATHGAPACRRWSSWAAARASRTSRSFRCSGASPTTPSRSRRRWC